MQTLSPDLFNRWLRSGSIKPTVAVEIPTNFGSVHIQEYRGQVSGHSFLVQRRCHWLYPHAALLWAWEIPEGCSDGSDCSNCSDCFGP